MVNQIDFSEENVYHIYRTYVLYQLNMIAPLSIGEGFNRLWLNAEKSGIIKVDNFPVREV
jgi:hypothetical protein